MSLSFSILEFPDIYLQSFQSKSYKLLENISVSDFSCFTSNTTSKVMGTRDNPEP